MRFLSDRLTPVQLRDATLAFAFLALVIWFFTREVRLIYLCMGILLTGMAVPKLLTLPAKAWFGLSHVLGQIMSRVILSLIYLAFLLPVAFILKAMGKDSLRFTAWRNGQESAFIVREHQYTRDDLKHPY